MASTGLSGRPLRVLFFADRDASHPGLAGGDLTMWEHARYLAHRGHTVTVVTSRFAGAPSEETVDNVRVVRAGGLLSQWWRAFLYYQRHARGRCDLVVAEGFGGSRIPRFTGLYVTEPVITEWHQVHHDLFRAQYPDMIVPLLDAFERGTALLQRGTVVRALTEEWRDALQTLGFHRERIVVIPVCIQDEWLDRAALSSGSEPTIVWIGKFRRYKCPDHVVRAMRQVVDRLPSARLVLAGRHDDTGYEERLRSLAASLGLTDHIEFQYNISEADKRALLQRARALVLPSSVEGFGIVALEAYACAVPVVASSGVPESVVAHGHAGLRYPFGDISALGQQLLELLQDDVLHRRLAGSALEIARSHSWQNVGARFESVVHEVLAQRSPGRTEPAQATARP